MYTAPVGTVFHPVIGFDSNKILYGTDPAGGAKGKGLVFALNEAGQLSTVYSFSGPDGAQPNGRLAKKGGLMIGTTVSGGPGTVFSINTSCLYKFATLDTFNATTEGTAPLDGVTVNPQNGLLVGTTSAGALAPGNGAVFTISSTGAFTVNWLLASGADGHCPCTGVAIDAFGTVYGTTVGYGSGGNPKGSVWCLPSGGTLRTLYAFTNGADGEYPGVAPGLDAAGNVWGVSSTQKGQPYAGVIWEITPTGGFSIVHSFNAATDGFGPNAPLLPGLDGNLYGTTQSGGAGNLGTLFRIMPAGAFTVLHSFTGGADGGVPTNNLTLDTAGQVYGGTALGTIFRYHP